MKRLISFTLVCLILLSLMTTAVTAHSCVDKDRDYWCDECGMLIYHTCVDRNKDTWCDLCSCWIKHDCYDRDADHFCDQCGTLMNISVNITVTSYLSDQSRINLVFYEGSYPSVIAGVYGSPAQHTFSCAAKSRFELYVSKPGHATRTYRETTYLSDINIDATLYPYGDVSQDGKVNVGDVARVYAHIRGSGRIIDSYILECADATGDGDLNIGDAARIYGHTRGSNPLF